MRCWRWTTKRNELAVVVILGAACLPAVVSCWDRVTIRESGHGFALEDNLVLAEYGYSEDGDRLRFAIFRTWPKGSTQEERMLDTRVARDFFVWPLIRGNDGRMIPAGTDGNVYFFEGNSLRTVRVRMNEHSDMMPLENMKSLDEVWNYLQQFRVD